MEKILDIVEAEGLDSIVTIKDVNDNQYDYVICDECFAVNKDDREECWDCGCELEEALKERNASEHSRSVTVVRIQEQITSWIDMYSEDGAADDVIWDCVVEV